jgi:hypothetical protein
MEVSVEETLEEWECIKWREWCDNPSNFVLG